MASQQEGGTSLSGNGSGPRGTTGQDKLPSYGEATSREGPSAAPATDEKGRSFGVGAGEHEDGDGAEPGGGNHEAGAGPSSSSSPPPGCARQDPTARTYLLRPPFIYSCAGDGPSGTQTPAYQVSLRKGRPSQLGIRPLQPSESRLLSLKGPAEEDMLGHEGPTVRFDNDTALYLIVSVDPLLEDNKSYIEGESSPPPSLLRFKGKSPSLPTFHHYSPCRLKKKEEKGGLHAAKSSRIRQSAVRDPKPEGRRRRRRRKDTTGTHAFRGAGVLVDGVHGRDQGQRQREVLAHDC